MSEPDNLAPRSPRGRPRRQAMLRMAIGLLGGALEWGNARQLAEVLEIPLD